MRVISQNGLWNIPYEQTSFKVDGNVIQADLPTGKLVVIAQYETEGQAQTAMTNLIKLAIAGDKVVARFEE